MKLTAFVEQLPDGDEAVASDPVVPLVVRSCHRVSSHLIVVAVVVVEGTIVGNRDSLPHRCDHSSAVAEMGDRLTDHNRHGPKSGPGCCASF